MSNKSIAIIATMGIDIGKNSFHVVGLDQHGAGATIRQPTLDRVHKRILKPAGRSGAHRSRIPAKRLTFPSLRTLLSRCVAAFISAAV